MSEAGYPSWLSLAGDRSAVRGECGIVQDDVLAGGADGPLVISSVCQSIARRRVRCFCSPGQTSSDVNRAGFATYAVDRRANLGFRMELCMNLVGHYAIAYGHSTALHSNLCRHIEERVGEGPIVVVDNNPVPLDRSLIPVEALHIDLCRNVGPAGAARVAILVLAAMGSSAVAGGDDDRVGSDRAMLETLNETLNSSPSDVAAVAAYGSFYSDRLARQKKPSVRELTRLAREGRLLAVGAVGGGRPSVWRVDALRNAGLHRPELFFGKEDFELGSRLRRNGFRILVIPEFMIAQLNREAGLIAGEFASGPVVAPWRRYYNSRNATYLARIEGRPAWAFPLLLARISSVLLRRGIPWRSRVILAWCEIHGFFDGLSNRMGKTVEPRGYD